MNESSASYPFPVMGAGRLDYIPECSYATSDWSIASGHVELVHRVDGESLISQLIKENKAGFGCAIVIPSTMYRLISICEDPGSVSAKHAFEIEEKYRSIHSIKFLPIVFYKGESQKFIADRTIGVDEIWHGQEFILQKGAIIARDSWHEIDIGVSHLLNVQKWVEFPKGMMDVNIVDEDGGYFCVRLSSDLYEGFQRAKTQKREWLLHRNSILTHALSAGLEKLSDADSGNADWDSLENFQTLKRTLEEKNMSWDETDFDPCKAACVYLPHCFNSIIASDEE